MSVLFLGLGGAVLGPPWKASNLWQLGTPQALKLNDASDATDGRIQIGCRWTAHGMLQLEEPGRPGLYVTLQILCRLVRPKLLRKMQNARNDSGQVCEGFVAGIQSCDEQKVNMCIKAGKPACILNAQKCSTVLQQSYDFNTYSVASCNPIA